MPSHKKDFVYLKSDSRETITLPPPPSGNVPPPMRGKSVPLIVCAAGGTGGD
jgi:hypothetical protein